MPDGAANSNEGRPKVRASLRVNAASGARSADLYIYGPIGDSWYSDGISANDVATALKTVGSVGTINLRINSEGGDCMDARAIYTLLSQNPADKVVFIDGLAASAASLIAMVGKTISIAEGGFVMIHNASTIAMGTADDFRRAVDLLESVNQTLVDTYVARTKNTADQVKAWMDAETWMAGPDAVQNGFADQVMGNVRAAASVRPLIAATYKHMPSDLHPNRRKALAAMARVGMRPK